MAVRTRLMEPFAIPFASTWAGQPNLQLIQLLIDEEFGETKDGLRTLPDGWTALEDPKFPGGRVIHVIDPSGKARFTVYLSENPDTDYTQLYN